MPRYELRNARNRFGPDYALFWQYIFKNLPFWRHKVAIFAGSFLAWASLITLETKRKLASRSGSPYMHMGDRTVGRSEAVPLRSPPTSGIENAVVISICQFIQHRICSAADHLSDTNARYGGHAQRGAAPHSWRAHGHVEAPKGRLRAVMQSVSTCYPIFAKL
eukprot:6176264-Pleurochrysis_carterae.AAC.1